MNDPAPTPTITLKLNRRDVRFILEALQDLQTKWEIINRTTPHEDEQADYGMDATELHGTREFIQDQALSAFGPNVTNFSRQPIAAGPLTNGQITQPR